MREGERLREEGEKILEKSKSSLVYFFDSAVTHRPLHMREGGRAAGRETTADKMSTLHQTPSPRVTYTRVTPGM